MKRTMSCWYPSLVLIKKTRLTVTDDFLNLRRSMLSTWLPLCHLRVLQPSSSHRQLEPFLVYCTQLHIKVLSGKLAMKCFPIKKVFSSQQAPTKKSQMSRMIFTSFVHSVEVVIRFEVDACCISVNTTIIYQFWVRFLLSSSDLNFTCADHSKEWASVRRTKSYRESANVVAKYPSKYCFSCAERINEEASLDYVMRMYAIMTSVGNNFLVGLRVCLK